MITRGLFCLVVVCGVLAGCGTPDRPPCPVSGQVLVNERPVEGVYVALYPAGGAAGQPTSGSARTAKDGSFALQVPAPGEYAVTAFWHKTIIENGDAVEGEDVFKGRYRNPQQPVQKITIREDDNALPPIRLKSL